MEQETDLETAFVAPGTERIALKWISCNFLQPKYHWLNILSKTF
jgi:hypothetical protein